MDSFDEKKFRRAVSGLPSTVIATIAIRAAMRVLPILAGRRTSLLGAQRRPVAPFSYWNNSDQAGGHLFGLFRSYQASIFIDSLIATDQGPARAASDVANKAAEAARNAARVVSNAVEAAVNASEGASSDQDRKSVV